MRPTFVQPYSTMKVVETGYCHTFSIRSRAAYGKWSARPISKRGHWNILTSSSFPAAAQASRLPHSGAKGTQAVREFVRTGGGYVGICAGSFLATTHLGMVNARANGSKGFGWVKLELTDVGRDILGQYPDLLAAVYSAGPIFSPAGKRRPSRICAVGVLSNGGSDF